MLSVNSSNHSIPPGSRRFQAQELTDRTGQENQSFDSTADEQETPAIVARHVVHGEPGQRRGGEQYLIKESQCVTDFTPELAIHLQMVLQTVERVPVVERKMLAYLRTDPQQAAYVAGQSVLPLIVADGGKHPRFKFRPMNFLLVGPFAFPCRRLQHHFRVTA